MTMSSCFNITIHIKHYHKSNIVWSTFLVITSSLLKCFLITVLQCLLSSIILIKLYTTSLPKHRTFSNCLLCVIITCNHLPLFKIFSNFVYFCSNFQIFCPFCSFLTFFFPFSKKLYAFP